jgi:hypothetical protein
MAKKKVFVSYDYNHDHHLKGTLIGQARQPDSPFAINDFSLKEQLPEKTWVTQAQRAISKCDIFIVLLGPNTHNAHGVLSELQIAEGLKKRRFQLRPQGKKYPAMPRAGLLVVWKWKNLKKCLG